MKKSIFLLIPFFCGKLTCMEEAALTVIPAGKYNNTIIATLDDLKNVAHADDFGGKWNNEEHVNRVKSIEVEPSAVVDYLFSLDQKRVINQNNNANELQKQKASMLLTKMMQNNPELYHQYMLELMKEMNTNFTNNNQPVVAPPIPAPTVVVPSIAAPVGLPAGTTDVALQLFKDLLALSIDDQTTLENKNQQKDRTLTILKVLLGLATIAATTVSTVLPIVKC
ncbi:hypothetical protein IPH25_04215 [bacterium]|nr:MAG: hypothetical protein IPG37_01210 [bacterium]QQR61652.1 MAG: hypothetical protein IPH25_04215 [bacterium]QQR62782.1 MAG: hypothetical protein IPH67_05240 [bacterium]